MMENPTTFEQNELDLLVDGELSEDRRRSLLSRLERDPKSWRQLALTFVENQVWKGGFQRIVSDSPMTDSFEDESEKATVIDGIKLTNRTSSRFRYRDVFLAVTVLIALGAGYLLGGKFSSVSAPENRTENTPWPELVILPDQPSPSSDARIVPVHGNANIPKDLKVIDWDDRPPRWSESLNPSLPPEFLNALRKSGLAVEENRELVPFLLEDGRSMFVPVNHVRMKYVGNNIFQ